MEGLVGCDKRSIYRIVIVSCYGTLEFIEVEVLSGISREGEIIAAIVEGARYTLEEIRKGADNGCIQVTYVADDEEQY